MKRKYFLWLFIAFLLSGLVGCDSSALDSKATEEYKMNHPSASQIHIFFPDISPDNKTLIFDYGSPYWFNIASYNISTESIRIYRGLKTKINIAPSFSKDGKKIVFLGSIERDHARNIYIINADGSDLRQITKYPEAKSGDFINAPSFSTDGKRIIYLRSHRERERAYPLRGSMHADWDIYEVDLTTGAEHRLTNYNFYEATWPYYMADGKRFIFSGEGPYNPTGKGPKNFKEYENQYQKNFIFIMDGRNNELKPVFVNGIHSCRPSVSADDTILFISRTNEMDGLTGGQDVQDLFLYKTGKITRLTKLNAYITLARISRDGNRIIFNKKDDKRSRDYSCWMMNSDGTGLKEIKIPMDKLKQ